MRTAVEGRLGVGSGDNFYTDAKLNRWINDALHFWESLEDWPWLWATDTFTTSADTGTQALPNDFLRSRALIIDDREYVKATITDIDAYDARDWYQYSYLYTVEGSNVVFRPIPGSDGSTNNATHRYVKTESELSGDSDTPSLPTRFRPAVVDKATEYAELAAGRTPQAREWGDRAREWERRMRDESKRMWGPRRIRVRPGGGIP